MAQSLRPLLFPGHCPFWSSGPQPEASVTSPYCTLPLLCLHSGPSTKGRRERNMQWASGPPSLRPQRRPFRWGPLRHRGRCAWAVARERTEREKVLGISARSLRIRSSLPPAWETTGLLLKLSLLGPQGHFQVWSCVACRSRNPGVVWWSFELWASRSIGCWLVFRVLEGVLHASCPCPTTKRESEHFIHSPSLTFCFAAILLCDSQLHSKENDLELWEYVQFSLINFIWERILLFLSVCSM